jgi:hypothetical protein
VYDRCSTSGMFIKLRKDSCIFIIIEGRKKVKLRQVGQPVDRPQSMWQCSALSDVLAVSLS